MKDIEKRLMELEEENRMFRMILDALPINLFVKDTHCKYLLTSKVCDMLNGAGRGELKGKTDFDLQKSREIAQNFYDDDQRIMTSKKGSRMLSPALCGDTVKYYDIYKEPVIGPDGNVEGILGLVIAPAEMSTEEKTAKFEEEVEEAYYGLKCLMFDYDIKTGNAIILKELEDFDLKYETQESFEKVFIKSGRIKEESHGAVGKLFEKIMKDETEGVLSLDIKDDHGIWHPAILNLTKIRNSKLNESRAIGVLSYINSGESKNEEFLVSINAMKKRLSQIVTETYDAVFYVSRKNQAYVCIGKSIGKLSSSGSMSELEDSIREYIHEDDRDIYMNAVLKKSETNRDGQHSLFEVRVKCEGDYRWFEANVYYMESIDGISEDIILTFYDMDEIARLRKQQEVRNTNNKFIEVLSSVVESRDVESGDHIHRMKNITRILLTAVMENYPQYELTEDQIEIMSSAATMHDIGKIAIPDMILLKPGRLTKEEFEIMKEHTVRGCKIINSASVIQDEEYYKYCYDICRHHHERYDGGGYPDGLKGEEISIVAQAVSVADVYDALISKRCYKDAYDEDKVIQMILNGECGVFNPKLIECLKIVRGKLRRLYFE